MALLFPGAVGDPSSWSGTPLGLSRGLEEAGARVVAVNTEAPPGVRFAVRRAAMLRHGSSLDAAAVSAELAAARTLTSRARLLGRSVDAAIMVGVASAPPGRIPFATYEDATVAQGARVGIPFVAQATEHAMRAWLARQRAAYEAARACCAGSRWVEDSIAGDYGIARSKVHVVGFGRNRTVRDVPRDWSAPRFLVVARDWEVKNGPRVLDAFERLRREVPDARLDVAGGHPAGLVRDGVTFHGFLGLGDPGERARLDALFERATCLVMPSTQEPFGIAHVEAASGGIPSIGTTVGGAADAVGDGGVLVDPSDPEALLGALRRLSDPATAERLGALARARAPLFTWRAVAERILAALGLHDGPSRLPA